MIALNQINLRFGTLDVLKDITFEVTCGETVGLAGMSGSGKSALAKIFAGLHQASSGTLSINGVPVLDISKRQQRDISVIHQYPVLIEHFDVVSNIFLGNEIFYPFIGKLLRIPNHPQMIKIASRCLATLGLQGVSVEDRVLNLTNEQRQLIAIARAMASSAQIIIIDEPTVLLGYPYQQTLLSIIQSWRSEGKTIIFSSTNLDHLFAVTDKIFVLRQGVLVNKFDTDSASREDVVSAMVGEPDQEHLTPMIWALDSYNQAKNQAERFIQQKSYLERDLSAQGTLNQHLLAQLSMQVKSLDQLNTALQDAQRRLLTERELERKHLARELHDQVIQDLLSTNFEIEAIEATLKQLPEYDDSLQEIRRSIRQMVEDIRRICGNLRPPTIDSLGLFAAIQSYTNEWSQRTGIVVDFEVNGKLGRLPEHMELSVFRIIQEGLQNTFRHADATRVQITLQHTNPRSLMISVIDNGVGFPEDFDLSRLAMGGHYGLIGISERVALLGGNLRVHNHQQQGAILQAEIPHPRVKN